MPVLPELCSSVMPATIHGAERECFVRMSCAVVLVMMPFVHSDGASVNWVVSVARGISTMPTMQKVLVCHLGGTLPFNYVGST